MRFIGIILLLGGIVVRRFTNLPPILGWILIGVGAVIVIIYGFMRKK